MSSWRGRHGGPHEPLDLIITIDTTTAHLAGARGKPVLLATLTPRVVVWPCDGDGALWYPTMRVFRQEMGGDWGSTRASRVRDSRRALNNRRDPPNVGSSCNCSASARIASVTTCPSRCIRRSSTRRRG
jgi:hypothetical protein